MEIASGDLQHLKNRKALSFAYICIYVIDGWRFGGVVKERARLFIVMVMDILNVGLAFFDLIRERIRFYTFKDSILLRFVHESELQGLSPWLNAVGRTHGFASVSSVMDLPPSERIQRST